MSQSVAGQPEAEAHPTGNRIFEKAYPAPLSDASQKEIFYLFSQQIVNASLKKMLFIVTNISY
jgi:hypothetical protein